MVTNTNPGLTQFLDNSKPQSDKNINNQVLMNKLIIDGKKISNAALREFVYLYRYTKNMSDHNILELVMALDELVESENLDDDKLDSISKDPSLIKK